MAYRGAKISLLRRLSYGRLFVYGVPFILALILSGWLLYPSWQAYTLQKRVFQERQALLSRLQKQLQYDKPALEKELAQAKDLAQKVFVGLDPYIIVSELEKKIDSIPEIGLRSFRIIKRQDLTPSVQKIKLTLVLEGDIKGLLTFLEDLKQLSKPVNITHLIVSVRHYRRSYILNINLELEALYAPKAL